MKNKGFTLIELIMVTIILGILAAIAVPRYMGAVSNAEAAAEASTVAAIQTAVENYATQKYLETGRYSYPANPFDYIEVDGYVGFADWDGDMDTDDLIQGFPDGAWYLYISSSGDDSYMEVAHKRRDDNEYFWSYDASDFTDIDGDDRGANVGLPVENPNQEGEDFNNNDVTSGERYVTYSGDPDYEPTSALDD